LSTGSISVGDYARSNILADQVRVDVWHHHLRAFNEMVDAAASRWTTQVIETTLPPSIDSYGRIFKNGTLTTGVILGYRNR
jgi:hypothetical protein